jgi:hypothetical protein
MLRDHANLRNQAITRFEGVLSVTAMFQQFAPVEPRQD